MNKIAICIPTYKRPLMLRKLVSSIIECKLNKSLIKDVNIIIVDNDIDRTAELTVEELKREYNAVFNLQYTNYPVKGLSNVRNELIKNALMLAPDFLVFVDDDEYVTPDWLNELVKSVISNKADITMGPVLTEKNNKIPDTISCWLDRPNYPNNTSLKFLRTGNVIIDVKSLQTNQIRFDPRFNHTGGEDAFFGIQMLKKGATILWASNAIVYETVSEDRANINWLARRYYNGANIFTYILKIEKEYLKLSKKVAISFINILAGFFSLVIIPIPIRKRYWGLLKLSEGMGGLAGFFSIRYGEYKK
jgi:succinoglycan biosynthesis protein ExoM